MKLILATTSPYRIEIFKKLGIPFDAEESNVDGNTADRPGNPEELVKYLSKLKAEAVAKNHSEGIVVGFDPSNYYSMSFIESIMGNPLNVMMGIPVSKIIEMLKEAGYKIT